jgi:hypothetical protein
MPTHRDDGRPRFAFGHWGSRVALGLSVVGLIAASARVQPSMLRLLIAVGHGSRVKNYLAAVAFWLGPLLIVAAALRLKRFQRVIDLLGASCIWLLLWVPAIALNPYGRGGSDTHWQRLWASAHRGTCWAKYQPSWQFRLDRIGEPRSGVNGDPNSRHTDPSAGLLGVAAIRFEMPHRTLASAQRALWWVMTTTYRHDLGIFPTRSGSGTMTAQEAMDLFKANPGAVFPFGIEGCSSLYNGAQCVLHPAAGLLGGSGRVEVTTTPTSFTFTVLPVSGTSISRAPRSHSRSWRIAVT